MRKIIVTLAVICSLSACQNNNPESNAAINANTIKEPAVLNYTIVNVYPHDSTSYTEGLEWHDNVLYESSGDTKYIGISKLARVDLATGKDLQKIQLSKEYFGEGMTILNGKIYQLTWNEGKCFVYDQKTFKKIKEFSYSGEGWGMTNDGKYLIMDNSGNNLYYRDPETFQVVKTVGVFDNNGPVASINELEYVDGFIYANIWLTNYIIKIDPATGHVVGKADFSFVLDKYAPGAISQKSQANDEVLNGIAYDSVGKRFFITGKHWPKLFEVKFN
ncbi:MAG: glutaminyl-peptide cyclotransferase [Bacteroidota bacterium]